MTEIFGIKFAPLRVPLERRLQTLGVIHNFSLTLFAPVFVLVLPFVLVSPLTPQNALLLIVCSLIPSSPLQLFTIFWPLVFVYLVWMWYDWDSPRRGAYPSQWVRNWRVHKWFADYFPVTLHKTGELRGDQVREKKKK